MYHVLNNAPRRIVKLAMTGVKMPLPPLPSASTDSSGSTESTGELESWKPIWPTDNPPSVKWDLYTRGNVGEVFPDVVLPLTWGLYGQRAEDGWRAAFADLGLLMPGDIPEDEDMVILSVFGGYCYINASYVRLLGVRAPGGTVDAIDMQFFGESDAPAYEPRPGHKNRRSSARLGKTVFRLLGAKKVPGLMDDKDRVADYLAAFPSNNASDGAFLTYLDDLGPLFQHLFHRHIDNTFSVALVVGAVADLLTKAGHEDKLVAILGGIGDIESAAPSSTMWDLARATLDSPPLAAAFDEGVSGLYGRLESVEGGTGWLQGFDQFIADFGSRGPNEWDLGSDPWDFRPELALAAIDRMRSASADHDPRTQAARLTVARKEAIEEVRDSLNRVDRFQFDKALASTTLYSQARERSKTTVILAIHGARRAAQVLTDRIAERGGEADRARVCMLTRPELAECLENPTGFSDLIDERAALHANLSGLIPPFIVEGNPPSIDTWQTRGENIKQVTTGGVLTGIAGCGGVARGRARVVLDPGDPGDLGPGDVLIAPITDPSWTPLFLAAEAVVVDVGATMSHAVIVSRELGIPCVVSAVGATDSIPDGAMLEVDGNNGTVTVLAMPGEDAD